MLEYDTIIKASVADDQHALADEAGSNVFGDLAGSATSATVRKEWEESIRPFEDQYMNEQVTAPDKIKKNGEYKYRTFLPKAWSSAKSVVGQAIEYGIVLNADSKKTATEENIKVAKNLLNPKSQKQRFDIVMGTARKIANKLGSTEIDELSEKYGIDFNTQYWRE